MFDPQMELLTTLLAKVADEVAQDPTDKAAWNTARKGLLLAKETDEDLTLAIELEDLDTLRTLLDEWNADKRHLPECDRNVLKRAMKAYRKSLKVTRLDAESTISGSPMSAGRESAIVGIRPPDRYPREVWDELVRQKRLLKDRYGSYELPPE